MFVQNSKCAAASCEEIMTAGKLLPEWIGTILKHPFTAACHVRHVVRIIAGPLSAVQTLKVDNAGSPVQMALPPKIPGPILQPPGSN